MPDPLTSGGGAIEKVPRRRVRSRARAPPWNFYKMLRGTALDELSMRHGFSVVFEQMKKSRVIARAVSSRPQSLVWSGARR